MGAFQDLRNDRQKRAACSHTVGFNISDTEESINATDSFYSPITIDDIIRFGMVEELAGRIQQVINFRRMSDESMLHLIRCKTDEIGEEMGIHIELSDQAERELLSIAFGNLGLRTPLNRIRELVINTIAAAFFIQKLEEKEIIIHIKNMKEAQIKKNIIANHKSNKENLR